LVTGTSGGATGAGGEGGFVAVSKDNKGGSSGGGIGNGLSMTGVLPPDHSGMADEIRKLKMMVVTSLIQCMFNLPFMSVCIYLYRVAKQSR
jgi:hypothetical protein